MSLLPCVNIMAMPVSLAKPVLRVCLFAAATVLLAIAVFVAVRQVDLQVLATVKLWVWLLFAALVACNLFLASLMFWVVTLSFDATPRVGLGRMTLLVTASALLNFLPFRPGLVGRAVILRNHHALPLRQSALILLIILATGSIVTLIIGLCALFIRDVWMMGSVLFAVSLLLSGLSGSVASKLLRRPMVMAWLWVPIRLLDALVASLRLWLAFWAMGHTLDLNQSLLAGAAGLLIAMIGLTPNGLGLKEWAIAFIVQSAAVTTLQVGLAASLVDRSMEALVVIVFGLVAIWCMRKWLTEKISGPMDDVVCDVDKPTMDNSGNLRQET